MTPAPSTYHIQSDSGETFGTFKDYPSAHRWIIRHGLEFEPLCIVSVTSISKAGWLESPKPLHLLRPERWLSLA
ncbi:MAG: hypothetical protein EBR82_39405 [Caulobacteraceae bacterium]|nr:hypothetical protein [Caulobacteraceae bacterium]